MAIMPRPPALGVWLSVPIIIPPGKAYCSSTTWWMMPSRASRTRCRSGPTPTRGSRRPRRLVSSRPEQVDPAVLPTPGSGDRNAPWRDSDLRGSAVMNWEGHLGGGVLHGDQVRTEVVVGDARSKAAVGSSRWAIRDLLGQGQRTAEGVPARCVDALPRSGRGPFDELDRGGCGDGPCRSRFGSARSGGRTPGERCPARRRTGRLVLLERAIQVSNTCSWPT